MATPMERLPVELVDMIVVYMSISDRQSLRLVSKQLYSLTLTTFSSRYFSRRVTTLGVPSLRRLLNSSEHLEFSNSVTLLDVKLLNHEDYGNLRKIHRVGIYPPPKRFPKVPQVRTEDISLESGLLDYMRTNHDPKAVVHPLSRAIKRFPNLKTVRLRVNGLTLYGNSYINVDDHVYQTFMSACFKAVLDAIIRSGIKLQEFTLIKGTSVRPLSKSANLIYPAFDLPFPYLLSIKNAFSSLKSLRLSIRTNYNGKARVPGWENGVSQFISAIPLLEDLTLCLQARDSGPWFRATVMHSVCRSVELPALKSLQLYGCVVDELDIIAFLKTHASTLRRLLISDTELRTGAWYKVLRSFIENLNLDYLRLHYLQQSARPQDIQWGREESKSRTKMTIDRSKGQDRAWMQTKLSEATSFLVAAAEALKAPES